MDEPTGARIRWLASDPGLRTTPSSNRLCGKSAPHPPSSPRAVALPLKERVLVDLCHPPATPLPPVGPIDPLPIESAAAPAQRRIGQQAKQTAHERGAITSGADEPALSVHDELWERALVRDHDRELARHRLGHRGTPPRIGSGGGGVR